jgi:3',5'-cyclic AMP phosphodiesterase CpdA
VVSAALLLAALLARRLPAQPQPADVVRAITPPARPLPAEADSASVRRFSFIAYGDTRGRRDGRELQYEHSLVVDAQLAAIKRLESSPFPVRFVLQTGDAVVNGRDARQWNESFVGLINRLTTEGGVPYFLAPGNHDVTGSAALDDAGRQQGLRHYLQAIAGLIPPDGAPRRLAGYPTYAFGYGNTFVMALDSNIAGDPRQLEWARAQLEGLDRARYVHVVVFFHHPPFSSGPHGGPKIERPTAELRAGWLAMLRRHRVALTLSGHEHLFEHWVERYDDPAGRRRRIDHVVTGGGGAPIYSYVGMPDLAEYLKANAAEKVALEQLARPGLAAGDNPYHFVIVQVDGDDLRLEVVGVDWGRGFQPYKSRNAVLKDQ